MPKVTFFIKSTFVFVNNVLLCVYASKTCFISVNIHPLRHPSKDPVLVGHLGLFESSNISHFYLRTRLSIMAYCISIVLCMIIYNLCKGILKVIFPMVFNKRY